MAPTPPQDAIGSGSDGGSRWLFTLTILVGSFLLFLVQPMVARMALPRLGGAPAVWNSAMLVYQALLLGGYAWAHWIGRFSQRTQVMLHCGLLIFAMAFLPVGLAAMQPPSDAEVFLFVPALLLASIGPLLFAISAQAPLMQRWFADTAPGANPYALYAASNLGSFGGLIAYPLLVEPNLPLAAQSWGWSALYAMLVLLVMACGLAATRAVANRPAPTAAATAAQQTAPRPAARTIALWIALSAVPSGLMLSTTTHLTTDIMAMPLLWAIPLGLYLLSFSVAFAERRGLANFFTLLAPPILLVTGGVSMLSQGNGNLPVAAGSLFMLFVVAVSLHARLYESRPAPSQLTLFYLMMAVGGALGGLFCALIAPLLFDWVYEHPLLILAAALLLPLPTLIPLPQMLKLKAGGQRIYIGVLIAIAIAASMYLMKHWSGWFMRDEVIAICVLLGAGLAAIGSRLAYGVALVATMLGVGGLATLQTSLDGTRTRSYFGIYTVRDVEDGTRTLAHGTTLHGTQIRAPQLQTTTTSYYGPDSGVGLAFERAGQLYGPNASIGVVGLGTGTLACYHQPGQHWQFFEIDPAMVRISRDSGAFTFVRRCAPDAAIRIGDARLTLRDGTPADSIDLLAIDAFSSDAIPLHLLTREAFDVYDRALTPGGIAMVHISNRFVNLEPVLAALVQQAGWHAMVRYDIPDRNDAALSRTASVWVAMSRNPAAINRLVAATANVPNGRGTWRPLASSPPPRLWTDDYASVLPLLIFPESD
jgi:hypothetical protein